MIVKNEEHIILNTIKLLTPYINYWIIFDTGSTDNNKDIILNLIQMKFKNYIFS